MVVLERMASRPCKWWTLPVVARRQKLGRAAWIKVPTQRKGCLYGQRSLAKDKRKTFAGPCLRKHGPARHPLNELGVFIYKKKAALWAALQKLSNEELGEVVTGTNIETITVAPQPLRTPHPESVLFIFPRHPICGFRIRPGCSAVMRCRLLRILLGLSLFRMS